MVRTSVGKGLVRIGREADVTLKPSGGTEMPAAMVHPIWIIGPNGRVTDEFVVTPLEPRNYEVTSQLYQEARNRALDSNQVLQSMIDSLSGR